MKCIYGAAIAAALTLAAAQPAASQVEGNDCFVAGGGQIRPASGGQATFGGSADSTRSSIGHEVYVDHGPTTPLRFQSLFLTAVICNLDARRAEITGAGQVDTGAGAQFVEFRIAVFAPNNRAGAPDTYRITLSNGYDSGEQPVRGNINLVQR